MEMTTAAGDGRDAPQPADQVQPVDPGAATMPGSDSEGAVQSVLERISAERDARLRDSKTIELPIPTWDGAMVATYGHLDEANYNRYVEKLGPDPKPSLGQQQDILIAACQKVELVEGDTRTELSDGYNRRLARRLAIAEPEKALARDVVLHMVGGRTMLLTEHAGKVLEFLQGGSQEVEQKLTGEPEVSSD